MRILGWILLAVAGVGTLVTLPWIWEVAEVRGTAQLGVLARAVMLAAGRCAVTLAGTFAAGGSTRWTWATAGATVLTEFAYLWLSYVLSLPDGRERVAVTRGLVALAATGPIVLVAAATATVAGWRGASGWILASLLLAVAGIGGGWAAKETAPVSEELRMLREMKNRKD